MALLDHGPSARWSHLILQSRRDLKQAEEMRSALTKPEWKLGQKYKMFISSLMRQTTLRENGNYNLTVTDWRCHCCCCTPTNSVVSWAYLLQEPAAFWGPGLGSKWEALGEGDPSHLPGPGLALPPPPSPPLPSPAQVWGFPNVTDLLGIWTCFATSTYHMTYYLLKFFPPFDLS